MTDEYEVADENQVKILVDKINALNNKAKKVIKVRQIKQKSDEKIKKICYDNTALSGKRIYLIQYKKVKGALYV